MKHLRIFENYKSDEEIHEICKRYKIEDYTINKDGSINVIGDVKLYSMGLTELPLIFNILQYGDFDCSDNKLTTLKGSPRIVNGDFICYRNNLTDLIGSPEEVKGNYSCSVNEQLTSLEGITKTINGNLYMKRCNLIDFKGIPEDLHVGKLIDFYDNPVYWNINKFLGKYNSNILKDSSKVNILKIKDKYLDLILDINDYNAIQDGKIVDIRMDEVLYNIGLI